MTRNSLFRRLNIRALSLVVMVMTVTIFTSTACQSCKPAQQQFNLLYTDLPSMNLTLVALNGTQLELDEVDIGQLPSHEGYGGYKNVLGYIRGLGKYTGVTLIALCDLIGGITSNSSLLITAADQYVMTFSYEQVNGDFTTYDNQTGEEVPHTLPISPILAYYFNDANISADDGPLRMAIVGQEGLATFSGYWVKQIVKLEIRYRDLVEVTSVTSLKTVVAQNYTCSVNVTVENQGVYESTFNVTVYANQTDIGTQTATLAPGGSTMLMFQWNTTGFALGDYSIRARVGTGEPFTGEGVCVSIPGDVNGDGTVDIFDAIILAGAYAATPGIPNWDPNADINCDLTVDIFDALILARNFGKP